MEHARFDAAQPAKEKLIGAQRAEPESSATGPGRPLGTLGDLLWLQRHAGNRAVVRVLGQDVVQRKRVIPNLPNRAVEPGDTVENPDTIAVGPTNAWSYAYDLAPAPAAANREEAVAAARSAYRTVGQSFTSGTFLSKDPVAKLVKSDRTFAKKVFDIFAPPGQVLPADVAASIAVPDPRPTGAQEIQDLMKTVVWTSGLLDRLRGADSIDTLDDPSRVSLRVPYGPDGAPASRLDVKAMFSEGQKGYIIGVTDTSSGTDATMKKRANYAGETPGNVAQLDNEKIDRGRAIKTIKHYSNVHHTATTMTAGQMIGGLDSPNRTKAQVEGGVDAITKVIAEGGRFQCVERLGLGVRNDSLFFAQLAGGGYRTIELRKLWKVWAASPFSGRYGIADTIVKDFLLRAQKPAVVEDSVQQPPATGYHYDVVLGQPR